MNGRRILFVENVVAPGIVGAAVELTISAVPEDQTATAARTSSAGHSCVPALLVSIDISKVLFTVGFRGGDYLKKPSAIEAHLIRRKNYIPVLLDVWHHVVHIQDRLLCRHIDVGITWENDNPIDGDIIPKYKPSQSLDMPVILPNGITQLMLLCKAVALVSGIRQILLPELGITAAIDLSVNILGLQHKYAVAGDNNMVDLCGVIPVTNQEVIVNPVVFTVQVLQER